jgi:hypothetical protein
MSLENHPNLHAVQFCTLIASKYFSKGSLLGEKENIVSNFHRCLRGKANASNVPDISKKIDILIGNSAVMEPDEFQEHFLDWLLDIENFVDFVVEDFAYAKPAR